MKIWHRALILAGVALTMSAHGQQSLAEANRLRSAAVTVEDANVAGPATSLDDALHLLFQQAVVVFTGEVVSIEPTEAATTVRFRVDHAIRGVTHGDVYTLREWSGLWADDPSRYVVGERRLMLLHAPSSAGFSSPAGGSLGSIRLRGDSEQQTADLRWLATAVLPAVPSARAMMRSSFVREDVPDSSAVDGTVITDMLHAWQRAEVSQ